MSEPRRLKLVNPTASGSKAAELEAEARNPPRAELNPFKPSDLEMFAIGGFSPLEGFMTQENSTTWSVGCGSSPVWFGRGP